MVGEVAPHGHQRDTAFNLPPLRVLCIVKNAPASFERENKNVGYFSYPVPEFTWEYRSPGKGFSINTREVKREGYDLIFHIDGGNWGAYMGDEVPVVYYAIDSTLSEQDHYLPRKEQAARADLVLVDHDRLERFAFGKRPVRRWSYCVNDKLFSPLGKTLDVCFHCGSSPERAEMREALSRLCSLRGYSYRSGTVPLPSYANDMGQARIVVNVPRTPTNRPHRVFDAMACGVCLVTLPLPEVSDEARQAGCDYLEYVDVPTLVHSVGHLLDSGTWIETVQSGLVLVRERHTWAVRARELRWMLFETLGV
jgi:spore maturation protein CgeB